VEHSFILIKALAELCKVSIITMGIGVGTLIAGLFGMNVRHVCVMVYIIHPSFAVAEISLGGE
jgi:D-arabinose 5-phosphate isomerase GutQ